jgi:hypothetical protein
MINCPNHYSILHFPFGKASFLNYMFFYLLFFVLMSVSPIRPEDRRRQGTCEVAIHPPPHLPEQYMGLPGTPGECKGMTKSQSPVNTSQQGGLNKPSLMGWSTNLATIPVTCYTLVTSPVPSNRFIERHMLQDLHNYTVGHFSPETLI